MLTLRANIGILAWKASINLKVQIRLGILGLGLFSLFGAFYDEFMRLVEN